MRLRPLLTCERGGSALETVVQFVSDPERSKQWYADLLGVQPTPYEGPYFRFDEHAYIILAQSSRGNIVGFIDNSKGGMPGRPWSHGSDEDKTPTRNG